MTAAEVSAADLRADEERASAGALAALTCPGRELPAALLRQAIEHAHAVAERQRSAEAVRDAEARLARVLGAGDAVERQHVEVARRDLDEARAELRRAMFVEGVHRGGLEAIRARVELISAGVRRQADAAAMAEPGSLRTVPGGRR